MSRSLVRTGARASTFAVVAYLLFQNTLAQTPPATDPGPKMEWATIPPGTFTMGCTSGDCTRELSAHEVHISKSFDVTRHQVTHEQWKFITGKYRREWIPGPKHPAFVRWNDTQDFIKKMNERKDGYRYRLLTDAEWEYIARAEGAGPTTESSDRVRSYGQIEWTDQVAVELLPIYPGAPPREPSCGMDLGQKPCPTPKRFSNPWGLYDILGDTPEWVEDWYGTPKEGGRLVRGGVLQTFMRGDGVIILLQPPRVWHKATGDPKKSRNGFRLAREQLK